MSHLRKCVAGLANTVCDIVKGADNIPLGPHYESRPVPGFKAGSLLAGVSTCDNLLAPLLLKLPSPSYLIIGYNPVLRGHLLCVLTGPQRVSNRTPWVWADNIRFCYGVYSFRFEDFSGG